MSKRQGSNGGNAAICYDYIIAGDIEQFNAAASEQRGCELRYLWRAVIAQSLTDALNNSKKLSCRIERAQAIAWFSLKNKDFLTVCSYADFDPHYVLDKVRKALHPGAVNSK